MVYSSKENVFFNTGRELDREISERKRAEQITRTLFNISNAVRTTKDLGELYRSIHRILAEVIDLTNFFIAIYDKEKRRVSFPYFVDQFDSGIVYADQFNEENSLTGSVIRNAKPVIFNRKALEERRDANRVIGTIPLVWIGVPLKIEGDVIGIMSTQSYDNPDLFDEIDLDILISASQQVALAIERKRNEQALIASEKKYRTIIETIEDGYYELDRNGNITLANQALCRMLELKANDLTGSNITGFMSEKSASLMKDSFTRTIDDHSYKKMLELELRQKNDQVRYIETVVSAIRDQHNKHMGFRGIARDVTERKKAERAQRLFEEQLQKSQRLDSLGTLAGGVAHDFNNLLMGIQGRLSLMQSSLDTTHPHSIQLAAIEEYVESAANLTSRLLGFARGGKYELRPANLNELVKKSIEMFGRTRKEILLETDFHTDLKTIEVDSNQIEQVLINMLLNASQAMENKGTISIRTDHVTLNKKQADFHAIKNGEYVSLVIADTGKGIEKEILNKIFDPFFTTKAVGSGTGLGLAMVYGIIRNHSGAISVTSEVSRGTSFTILLPTSEKVVTTTPRAATSTPAMKKGSGTILLVDDEPIITDIGEQMLSLLGYQVIIASSGSEAIEIYRKHRETIDLTIIDMIMPYMSGGELFDHLKNLNPEVHVLLSSGYSVEGEAREILNRGCKGFIQKPFNMSQLSNKIREILN